MFVCVLFFSFWACEMFLVFVIVFLFLLELDFKKGEKDENERFLKDAAAADRLEVSLRRAYVSFFSGSIYNKFIKLLHFFVGGACSLKKS